MRGGGSERGDVPAGARSWEESFLAHEKGWLLGDEPSTLARRLVRMLRGLEMATPLRLLDIGCGEGRDAAFLAAQGFQVEAIDGSPTAVARTREALARMRLPGTVEHADLAAIPWRAEYDVILAGNSVQFAGAAAPRVLGEIRAHTSRGGVNAIGMFTREELDWRRETDVYCLEPRELKWVYRDWTLLDYSESITWEPRRAQYLSFAYLIARRPGA